MLIQIYVLYYCDLYYICDQRCCICDFYYICDKLLYLCLQQAKDMLEDF